MSRVDYILYSNARERLESSGLVARVNDLDVLDLMPVGHLTKGDILEYARDLIDRGYVEKFPQPQGLYGQALQRVLDDPVSHPWRFSTGQGVVEKEPALEDFLLMIGWYASHVLTPQEMWKPQDFGFKRDGSPRTPFTEFHGAVGVLVRERMRTQGRAIVEANFWDRKHVVGLDPRVRRTHLRYTGHGDISIEQRDVTPYPTTDPVRNVASFRPVFDEDRSFARVHHSSEINVLALLLKYAKHARLDSTLLEHGAAKFGRFAEAKVRRILTTLPQRREEVRTVFENLRLAAMDRPFTVIGDVTDPRIETGDLLYHDGSTNGHAVFMDADRNLLFTTDTQEGRKLAAEFTPEDIDPFLRALITLTANRGNGERAVQELVHMAHCYQREYTEELLLGRPS